MKRRIVVAFLFAAVVIAMSARVGGAVAAQFSGAALALSSPQTSALTRVQYACGWTYTCTDLGKAGNVQIYGPVTVYTDAKPEIWRVPEGAYPWTGDQGNQQWRGWGCGGYPCDERCGAFCWFRRVRNGYCGHGCDAYRERVMFQPIGGYLRPYVYRNSQDGDCGYGSQDGRGYGCGSGSGQGPAGYGYGSGQGPGGYGYGGGQGAGGYGYEGGQAPAGYGSAQESYSQTSPVQQGYAPPADSSQNAPQDYGAPAPNGERFVDRLRRYFYERPRREVYGDNTAVRDKGAVRFERPSNDLVPLRRFNGPKYPPNSTGKEAPVRSK